MFTYVCFYKGKKVVVQALRSYDAQCKAAVILRARRACDVAVVLADRPVDPASI